MRTNYWYGIFKYRITGETKCSHNPYLKFHTIYYSRHQAVYFHGSRIPSLAFKRDSSEGNTSHVPGIGVGETPETPATHHHISSSNDPLILKRERAIRAIDLFHHLNTLLPSISHQLHTSLRKQRLARRDVHPSLIDKTLLPTAVILASPLHRDCLSAHAQRVQHTSSHHLIGFTLTPTEERTPLSAPPLPLSLSFLPQQHT